MSINTIRKDLSRPLPAVHFQSNTEARTYYQSVTDGQRLWSPIQNWLMICYTNVAQCLASNVHVVLAASKNKKTQLGHCFFFFYQYLMIILFVLSTWRQYRLAYIQFGLKKKQKQSKHKNNSNKKNHNEKSDVNYVWKQLWSSLSEMCSSAGYCAFRGRCTFWTDCHTPTIEFPQPINPFPW